VINAEPDTERTESAVQLCRHPQNRDGFRKKPGAVSPTFGRALLRRVHCPTSKRAYNSRQWY